MHDTFWICTPTLWGYSSRMPPSFCSPPPWSVGSAHIAPARGCPAAEEGVAVEQVDDREGEREAETGAENCIERELEARVHFVKNSKLNRMRCPNSTRRGSRLTSLHNAVTARWPAIDSGSLSPNPLRSSPTTASKSRWDLICTTLRTRASPSPRTSITCPSSSLPQSCIPLETSRDLSRPLETSRDLLRPPLEAS